MTEGKDKIIKSDFQLELQRLIEVNFNLKDNMKFNDEEPNLNIDRKIETNESEKIAKVTLSVKVEKGFILNVIIEGYFTWNEIAEEELKKRLSINAPSVLFSYVRSIVSNMVAFAGLPPIILPLINFQESKLETIDK